MAFEGQGKAIFRAGGLKDLLVIDARWGNRAAIKEPEEGKTQVFAMKDPIGSLVEGLEFFFEVEIPGLEVDGKRQNLGVLVHQREFFFLRRHCNILSHNPSWAC